MRLTTSLAGLVALAAPFCGASFLSAIFGSEPPLGINCRGSSLCPFASFDNPNPESIIQALRDVLWYTKANHTTVYNSDDHIACVGIHQTVMFVAGAEGKGVAARLVFSGNVHTGGICLFPQGGSVTLQEARWLADELLKWGCGTCGSVPLHFHDHGSNDPSAGILTFNYVKNPSCTGNCLTASGVLFSEEKIHPRSKALRRAGRSRREHVQLERWAADSKEWKGSRSHGS